MATFLSEILLVGNLSLAPIQELGNETASNISIFGSYRRELPNTHEGSKAEYWTYDYGTNNG